MVGTDRKRQARKRQVNGSEWHRKTATGRSGGGVSGRSVGKG